MIWQFQRNLLSQRGVFSFHRFLVCWFWPVFIAWNLEHSPSDAVRTSSLLQVPPSSFLWTSMSWDHYTKPTYTVSIQRGQSQNMSYRLSIQIGQSHNIPNGNSLEDVPAYSRIPIQTCQNEFRLKIYTLLLWHKSSQFRKTCLCRSQFKLFQVIKPVRVDHSLKFEQFQVNNFPCNPAITPNEFFFQVHPSCLLDFETSLQETRAVR